MGDHRVASRIGVRADGRRSRIAVVSVAALVGGLLTMASPAGGAGVANGPPPPIPDLGTCGDGLETKIHAIQGAGASSPLVGAVHVIEGVVVGDFQGATGLGGFFVQEEDADADADLLTSEGVFVRDGIFGVDVGNGDVVRVRGTVAEAFELTEISSLLDVVDCATTGTASAATVTLPLAAVSDLEANEGMLVVVPQTLHVSGNSTLGRFGEVDLSVGGPLDIPTNIVAPGAAALAQADLNNRSRIQLDDGSDVMFPLPLPPYLGAGTTLRTGDTIPGLTAVLGFGFGVYELHPQDPSAVTFTRINDRPTGPPGVGGSLTVASYNVLNYFTTLDDSGPICGPSGILGCRGADTASEFTRQKDKLVAALSGLDADIVGVIELENAIGDGPIADLVAGVNAVVGAGTYDFIATGAIGTDAIRVAIIYQPASVTPSGAFAILDSSVDPTFIDTRNRPVLAQTFVEDATGASLTVAVTHLKSKSSSCADIGDPDTGDGQGNCNLTRTAAAAALVNWLATDPTGSGDSDFLVIGELNAYAQEDPVTAIEAAGYTDNIEAFVGTGYASGAYSFNVDGESGAPDHALTSASLTSQVTGAAFSPLNADEPRGLDYNDVNQPGLYSADEFRSSDHDPVLVGLGLDPPLVISPGAAAVLEGGEGSSVVVEVPVTLSAPSATPVTVEWTTTGSGATPGIAAEGVDYDAASGTVTFAPFETVQTVPITVRGDDLVEPPLAFGGEWGLIAFSDPSINATIDTGVFFGLGIFVIVDDEPVISPGAAVTSDDDTSVVNVPVTLSRPSSSPVTVEWETFDTGATGVATENVDYLAASGTVTFAPFETLQTVPITVLDDDLDEIPLLFGEWGLIRFFDPSPTATLDLGTFGGVGIFVIVDED